MVVNAVKAGQLKPVEVAEAPFERTLGILARKGATLSVPAQKFIQTLLSRSKAAAS